MSRIGKLPIKIEKGVTVAVDGATVRVQGPKGKLEQRLPRGITAAVESEQVHVRRSDENQKTRALHGLSRALVANAVAGVSRGFMKELEIHGVGYRADVAGGTLKLALGYSHPIEFPIPEGIQIAVERNTRISIRGCDRQQVGQIAADIRALRAPDVYKHKGIRYTGELLRKKAGKTGAK